MRPCPLLSAESSTNARGAAALRRWPWLDWWKERKAKWVVSEASQMDEGRFRSIAVGTGLPPIEQRSTFPFRSARDGAERFAGRSVGGELPYARIYTRLGNPTTEYLERRLLSLEAGHVEEAERAAGETEPTLGCLVTSSGMGAIATMMLSLLESGDTVLLGSVYGCTDSLARGLSKFCVGTRFVDATDLSSVERAFDAEPTARLLVVESPDNPTLRLCDLRALSRICEAHGALLAVDNTFCSPYLQQPFRLGADIVFHSLTKHVNGHSASVGGALLAPFRLIRDELFVWYKDLGSTPSPFDAWLDGMTLQSLAPRQTEASATAVALAGWLGSHPAVETVHYPGFGGGRQAELAREQMRSGGSVLAFELRGGLPAAERFLDHFARHDTPGELAVSLGSAITYVEHPATMTHAVVPEAERLVRGIGPGLVRMSVGLEGPEALLRAVEAALAVSDTPAPARPD